MFWLLKLAAENAENEMVRVWIACQVQESTEL